VTGGRDYMTTYIPVLPTLTTVAAGRHHSIPTIRYITKFGPSAGRFGAYGGGFYRPAWYHHRPTTGDHSIDPFYLLHSTFSDQFWIYLGGGGRRTDTWWRNWLATCSILFWLPVSVRWKEFLLTAIVLVFSQLFTTVPDIRWLQFPNSGWPYRWWL